MKPNHPHGWHSNTTDENAKHGFIRGIAMPSAGIDRQVSLSDQQTGKLWLSCKVGDERQKGGLAIGVARTSHTWKRNGDVDGVDHGQALVGGRLAKAGLNRSNASRVP